MLDIPFQYSRNYYIKGMKRKDDVYPDARIEILHSSRNKRIIYEEGDTGTEAVDVIIEKIGKYHFKQYCRNNKNSYVMFTHEKKDNNFFGDYFPCLFLSDAKQVQIVYSLMEHYNCTLDYLIEKLEEYIEMGLPYEEICVKIEAYKQKTGLVFMLESLKNFAANGRVSPAVAKIAGVLGIRIVGRVCKFIYCRPIFVIIYL